MSSYRQLQDLTQPPRSHSSFQRSRLLLLESHLYVGNSKPRLTFKKLRTTTNNQTPINHSLTHGILHFEIYSMKFKADSGAVTLDVSREIPLTNANFFYNTNINPQKKLENLPNSLQNIMTESHRTVNVISKTTLANLTEGLAAWEDYDDDEAESPRNMYTPGKKLESQPQRQASVNSVNPVVMPVMSSHASSPVMRTKIERESYLNKTEHIREVRLLKGNGDYNSQPHSRNMVDESDARQFDTEMSMKTDIRWKECKTLEEDLEFLKTEESLEAMKKGQRTVTEVEPVVRQIHSSQNYKRSTSVRNRRGLANEFISWKESIEEETKHGIERGLLNNGDRIIHELRKENMVLPKLHIGDDNVVRKQKIVFGVGIKPQVKPGTFRQIRIRNGGGIKVEEYRDVYERSSGFKEENTDIINVNDRAPPPQLLKEVRDSSNTRDKVKEGVVVAWSKEDMKHGIEGGLVRDSKEKAAWKMQRLVPRIKVKKDVTVKKELVASVQRDVSHDESYDYSKEIRIENKIETAKGPRQNKEVIVKVQSKGEKLKGKSDAWNEMLVAQTILNQRFKILKGHDSLEKEDKTEIGNTKRKKKIGILKRDADRGSHSGVKRSISKEHNRRVNFTLVAKEGAAWEEIEFVNK